MAVHFQPDNYHTVIPYICVDGAAKAIDFYKEVFDAIELMRMPGPDGIVAHAEIKIGDATVMLADKCEKIQDPHTIGGVSSMIMVYVPNVDETIEKALARGATIKQPATDQFYGDRNGSFTDPFGHLWGVATHLEDLTQEEMAKRAAELHGQN